MLTFVTRRISAMVFVLFSISILVFLIFFATPGVDPAARIAGRNADQETLAQASFIRTRSPASAPLPVHDAPPLRISRPDLLR